MRPLGRPSASEKSRWENLARTKNAKKAIDDAINNGTKKPEELKSDDFENAWTDPSWKQALIDAQEKQCIWCTRKPTKGGSPGVVDHIRPKTEVHRDITIEVSRKGKKKRVLCPDPVLRPGYHWRAYDPDNLALCCDQCNRAKSTFWPVDPWRTPPAPGAWTPAQKGKPETELVLDPFDPAFDPLQHFRFSKVGDMVAQPGNVPADVTVLLVGLDEQHLTEDRFKLIVELELYVGMLERLFRDKNSGMEEFRLVQSLAEKCAWSSPHAAFYRVALHQLLQDRGWNWSDLLALWELYGFPANIPEPPANAWGS